MGNGTGLCLFGIFLYDLGVAAIFASAADHSPVDSALTAMHDELHELFG